MALSKGDKKRLLLGLIFTSPWLFGFLTLAVYPVGASFYYSLCDYNVFNRPVFIGFANYHELLFEDSKFWLSLWNTVYFMVFAIPVTMMTALMLAMLLNLKVRGQAFYRTIFFLPAIVPIVASTVLWLWVLNPERGIANMLLRPVLRFISDALSQVVTWMAAVTGGLGENPAVELFRALGYHGFAYAKPFFEAPAWLQDPHWSKPGLIIMSVWGAGHSMILYLASLQEVPKELYEAAEIDGASPWMRARHITIPMISPILFFTLVMGMIGTFQYFTQAFIMNDGGGGPANSMLFYALYLFNNAFVYFRMGYASAMAWIMFALILVCTALTFRGARGRVYYAGA